MNKYKRLINNSLVFTIGSFGSKLITFLMVPLYTHVLTTAEYGTVDLMTTTINFLIPLTTLELGQAALRFAVDARNEIEKNKLYSNIIVYSVFITGIIILITPLIIYFNLFDNFSVLFTLLLISNTINNILAQYVRGVGLVKQYAFNGILTTIIVVFSNLFFLIVLKFKVEGYINSLIISSVLSNLYLLTVLNIDKTTKGLTPDKNLLKDMLKFSLPIIPNSAMWWTISGSTRYFILYFVGTSGNGLFAVANKLPSIISMLTGIFSQAWQLSSFEEFESEDRDTFYSRIFNIYWVFLFIAGSAILVILKPLLKIVVEESYYLSWQVVPLLILAVIYQSFSAFLGTNYTAAKQTKGTFYTSVYGGIISLISSFMFVPLFGVIGAGVSSALSFFGMFLVRLYDTRKFIIIKVDIKPFVLSNLIFILQTLILFLLSDFQLFITQVILIVLMMIINKNTIQSIIKMLYSTRKSK